MINVKMRNIFMVGHNLNITAKGRYDLELTAINPKISPFKTWILKRILHTVDQPSVFIIEDLPDRWEKEHFHGARAR